jgi:hypothetical protein
MYQITPYTYAKAKALGVTVKPSTKRHKKLDVFRDGSLIASVGDTRYSDFPSYIRDKGEKYALERRRLYYIRHKGEGLAGELAKELLW